MNDTTIGPGGTAGASASGNRWEPVAGSHPVQPLDPPRDAPAVARSWSRGARGRAWLAGGLAALVVSSLGGFTAGQVIAPQGDGAPAYVEQGVQPGSHPGDHGGFAGDDGGRSGPSQGQYPGEQGRQGGSDEGSNT